MLNSFLSLVFPQFCAACTTLLQEKEHSVCTNCLLELPITNYHSIRNNPMYKIFDGRCSIVSAAAYFHFSKGGKVQELIHELKYRANEQVGFELGQLYGLDLAKTAVFNSVDMIIPVPLHIDKQMLRGYNQSVSFAKGLADSLRVPVNTTSFKRIHYTVSQTKKQRFDRWVNVEKVFEVVEPEKIQGKHVLLVDDVVTTGATLEACVNKLAAHDDISVSIATIAIAK